MARLLNIVGHGGGCCGIRHLQGFHNFVTSENTGMSKEDFVLKSLDAIVNAKLPNPPTRNAGIRDCDCQACTNARVRLDPEKYAKRRQEWITAVECVLAGAQYKEWKDTLVSCGFSEVYSFKNSNSGNMCHVFYGTTNPKVLKDVESAPQDTEIAV